MLIPHVDLECFYLPFKNSEANRIFLHNAQLQLTFTCSKSPLEITE